MNTIYPPLIPDNFTTSTLLNIKIPHRYPARMTSKIADFVIKNYTNEDDLILDPFCGSGSVLTAASANKRRSIGTDINPVAVAIATSYTGRYQISKLRKYLDVVLEELERENPIILKNYDKGLLYWFDPAVVGGILQIKAIIKKNIPKKYKLFFLVTLSSMVRSVSRADPKIFPPVYSKIMRQKKVEITYDEMKKSFEKKALEAIVSAITINKILVPGYRPKVKRMDAFEYLEWKYGEFDAIFTSPPYGFAQKYTRSTSLELMTVFDVSRRGISMIDKQDIGSELIASAEPDYTESMPSWLFEDNLGSYNSKMLISRYLTKMDKFIATSYKALKNGGKLLLLVGENRIGGGTIPIVDYLVKSSKKSGFQLQGSYIDRIKNYSLFTKRNSNSGVMRNEYLLVLKK